MRGIERILAGVLLAAALAGTAIIAGTSGDTSRRQAVQFAAPPKSHLEASAPVVAALPTPRAIVRIATKPARPALPSAVVGAAKPIHVARVTPTAPLPTTPIVTPPVVAHPAPTPTKPTPQPAKPTAPAPSPTPAPAPAPAAPAAPAPAPAPVSASPAPSQPAATRVVATAQPPAQQPPAQPTPPVTGHGDDNQGEDDQGNGHGHAWGHLKHITEQVLSSVTTPSITPPTPPTPPVITPPTPPTPPVVTPPTPPSPPVVTVTAPVILGVAADAQLAALTSLSNATRWSSTGQRGNDDN